MADFLVNPGSVFWAPLLYGRHAPNSMVHPAVELVVGQKIGNERLSRIEAETRLAAIGQKAAIEYHRHHQESLDRVQWLVADGFSSVHNDLYELTGAVNATNSTMRQGFASVGRYLQTGFGSLLDYMADATELTHTALRRGFSAVIHQQAQLGELMDNRLVQLISTVGASHVLLANRLDDIHTTLSSILDVQHQLHDNIGHVVDTLQQMIYGQRARCELEAQEHFRVGMTFFNAMRFDSAAREFQKGLTAWGGHFYTHLVSSHIAHLRGDRSACEDFLQDARAVGGNTPRHVALAHFYLGRLRIEERTPSAYGDAREHFAAAHNAKSDFVEAALEEVAAALLAKEPALARRSTFLQTLGNHFRTVLKVNEFDAWYKIALTVVGHREDIAVWVGGYALSIDPAARRQDRTSVVKLLKMLDSANCRLLISVLARQHPWLSER